MEISAEGESLPAEAIQSPVVKVARNKIGRVLTLALFVRAGGRCEFCNRTVVEHHFTKRLGVYGQQAHIVAYREYGPRGQDGPRPRDIDAIENLMLLCPDCHIEIDNHPSAYPRAALEKMKRDHERRIDIVTGLAPESRSHVIMLRAPIRGKHVAIPKGDAFEALRPRYPVHREWTEIDLSGLREAPETPEFVKVAVCQIDREVKFALAVGGPVEAAGHVSVFGLAPIALLARLGAAIGDKVPTDVFQRHRDTEDWRWKPDDFAPPVRYVHGWVRKAQRGAPVALVLSLSGKIHLESLPGETAEHHAIYGMTLDDVTPAPTFLNCRRDVEAFRRAYHEAQSQIADEHGDDVELNLFPAVPAPIAILCGRERLPKPRPPMRIYDFDHARGGFNYQLEID